MNPIKATAHRAGLLYFVFMILGIIGEFAMPAFMVPDDAAATARTIASADLTYRIDILLGFVTLVMFIFLVQLLYKLFQDVNKSQAMLMVLLVCVGVALALANLLTRFAPLLLLSGADYLSGFTKPQLDGLVLNALKFHSSGSTVVTGFWGLWLFPFGLLVIRSGFFPRILGVFLILAGVGYTITSVTSILFPEHRQLLFKVMMPLYLGEVPIIFWLLIKGAKVPEAQPSPAG
jgi:hypothetical protein